MSNYLSASRSRWTWQPPYMFPAHVAEATSDDGDDPDTTLHPPPSLPDIPDAISVSAQHLTNTSRQLRSALRTPLRGKKQSFQ